MVGVFAFFVCFRHTGLIYSGPQQSTRTLRRRVGGRLPRAVRRGRADLQNPFRHVGSEVVLA